MTLINEYEEQQFSEKGLVAILHSTAQKISELSSRALTEDDLTQETVGLFDELVGQARSTMDTIHEFRNRRA